MKEGWTYKKLGEVCNVLNGLWIGKKEPFVNVAVIRNTNFSKDCKLKLDDVAYIDVEERQFATRKLQVGDIIIEKSGGSDKQPVGRPVLFNIPDGDYSFSNFTSTLRLTDKSIFPPFLHYCLYGYYRNGETKKMQSKTTGLRNLDMKAYLRLAIPYFEIGEQERIVAELDLLQGIIEKKKEQLKAYDQLAQSIFYTMFGDPIDNPKGWETKKLGEVATQKLSYGSGASAIQYNGKIRYVRITDIREDGDLNSDIVSPDTFDEKYLLNEGDILFARSGATVGKTFQYKSRFGKCIFAGYLIRMIPNIEIVLPSFIFAYTKSSYYRSFVSEAQNAVAQPNINAKQYGDLLVPVPPISLQQEFAEKVEAIERQKALIQQSIDGVQTLFDSRMDYWFG